VTNRDGLKELGTGGTYQKDRELTQVDEVPYQVQEAVGGPMDVLESNHERTVRGDGLQELTSGPQILRDAEGPRSGPWGGQVTNVAGRPHAPTRKETLEAGDELQLSEQEDEWLVEAGVLEPSRTRSRR
jgi:hypothetical protein